MNVSEEFIVGAAIGAAVAYWLIKRKCPCSSSSSTHAHQGIAVGEPAPTLPGVVKCMGLNC